MVGVNSSYPASLLLLYLYVAYDSLNATARFSISYAQTAVGTFGILGNITSIFFLARLAANSFFDSLLLALTFIDTTFIVFTVIDYALIRGVQLFKFC